MASTAQHQHQHRISSSSTSYPGNHIPDEPRNIPQYTLTPTRPEHISPRSSGESISWSGHSSDSEALSTPITEPQIDELVDKLGNLPVASVNFADNRPRRASTTLISESPEDIRRILGDGETATRLIEKCCGGGCCLLNTFPPDTQSPNFEPVVIPDNMAFQSLDLRLGPLGLDTELTNIIPLPPVTLSFEPIPSAKRKHVSAVHKQPPEFVQPHPPYNVYSAHVYHARELTKPGAEKRTFHFDIDVTDYPDEGGVDFKVGGAIGICPPNANEVVDELFDILCIPKFVRDKSVLLKTQNGRWPTIWGEEKPRELVTTRRELLTWCADVQSHPPTKQILRVMAEHAKAPNEKKILLYLTSAQGQAAFCE